MGITIPTDVGQKWKPLTPLDAHVNYRLAEGWHKKTWVLPRDGGAPFKKRTTTVFSRADILHSLIRGDSRDLSAQQLLSRTKSFISLFLPTNPLLCIDRFDGQTFSVLRTPDAPRLEDEPPGREWSLRTLSNQLKQTFRQLLLEGGKVLGYYEVDAQQPSLLLWHTGLCSQSNEDIYCLMDLFKLPAAQPCADKIGANIHPTKSKFQASTDSPPAQEAAEVEGYASDVGDETASVTDSAEEGEEEETPEGNSDGEGEECLMVETVHNGHRGEEAANPRIAKNHKRPTPELGSTQEYPIREEDLQPPSWRVFKFSSWSALINKHRSPLPKGVVPPVESPERADWYAEGMQYSVFDYKLAPSKGEVDWAHMFQHEHHLGRLPSELRWRDVRSIQQRCEERLPRTLEQARANPRKAVPQFYIPRGGDKGQLQLLLPIQMGDGGTAPDCALVMRLVKHHNKQFYQVITILDKDQAYWNARLIQRIDQEWLYPSDRYRTGASAAAATPFRGRSSTSTHFNARHPYVAVPPNGNDNRSGVRAHANGSGRGYYHYRGRGRGSSDGGHGGQGSMY